MSVGIVLGAIALMGGIWAFLNIGRAKQMRELVAVRTQVHGELVKFAQEAIQEDSIQEIVFKAATLAQTSFRAQRLVLLQEGDTGWVATQPVGPPPPPVPSNVAQLFHWFRHNPLMANEAGLGHRQYGAMRSPLQSLMSHYAGDIVMPLVHKGELIAVITMALDRKPSATDTELLRIFRMQLTAACANVRLHHQASHLFNLAQEVDLAHSIELAMVPEELNGEFEELRWNGHFTAAGKAASDFWGVYPLDERRVMIVLGDSVNHDLGGSMVSAVLKSCCEQLLRSKSATKTISPSELLQILNASLFRGTSPALASCCVALLDTKENSCKVASAGHIFPYLLSSESNKEVEVFASRGPLLGHEETPRFPEIARSWTGSDRLVFLTNGMVQKRNSEGTEYGFRRFHRLLRSNINMGAEGLCASVVNATSAFAKGQRNTDDEAILIVERNRR